ncbi:MAG: SpoIIE family protein phosphatase [Bacteroidales bacterium]|nr:SpoIIE family protein phosphatase [Bacteroidales bacterium]
MRILKNILTTLVLILAAVGSSAQSYFVYGDMRNEAEKNMAYELMLVDTIVPKEMTIKVMHKCLDTLEYEQDYRKKIGSLSHICQFCQKINDTTFCSDIINSILQIGAEHKDRNAEIQAFLLRANGYHLASNHKKEIDYMLKASFIAEKLNNISLLAEIYAEISKAFSDDKDTYNCTKYLLDAIHLAEELCNPDLIADIYYVAGEFFFLNNDDHTALAYECAAIQYLEYAGKHEKLGKAYITLGYIYLNLKDYPKSLASIKRGIDLLLPTQNKHWMARAYNCAGYIGLLTNRPEFAEKNYIKSLQIRTSIGMESEIAEASASYSEFLLATGGNNDTIIKYLNQGFVMADKYGQVSQMVRITRNLAKVYASIGDYESAYKHAMMINNLKSQDQSTQNDKLRATIEFNSDLDKEMAAEMIRSSSKETIERQGNEILYLTIGITLIILLLTIIIIVLFNRTKQNKRLLTQKQQIQEKSLELQIKNMELERISFVAQYTNNGIAILNSSYVVEWLNLGIIKQLEGKGSINDYLHKPAAKLLSPAVMKYFEQCFKLNTGIEFESRWGDHKCFQVTLTPYTNRIGRQQIIAVTTDITKQKKVEDEIEKQKRELEMQSEMMVIINSELTAQKAAISEQNEQLEFKNREITESLEYARKIQDAIQPMEVFLEAVLKEYFVINFPKNIVSGDFHWFDYRDGNTYIALADCTGHGIPGAVMSMLGTVTLSNIISSGKTNNAAQVLDQLRSKIIKLLHQRGIFGEAQDGMDISLCVYNEEKGTINYAGAYSYTYLARFGKPDQQTIETIDNTESRIIESEDGNSYLICFKPDRMPIGIHTKDNIPFRNIELKVLPGDILYMTSDGFCDQFGGPKNKKYYTANLEKLLLSVIPFTLDKQKEILSETFLDWKGINEQVDDVHIIGVKL